MGFRNISVRVICGAACALTYVATMAPTTMLRKLTPRSTSALLMVSSFSSSFRASSSMLTLNGIFKVVRVGWSKLRVRQETWLPISRESTSGRRTDDGTRRILVRLRQEREDFEDRRAGHRYQRRRQKRRPARRLPQGCADPQGRDGEDCHVAGRADGRASLHVRSHCRCGEVLRRRIKALGLEGREHHKHRRDVRRLREEGQDGVRRDRHQRGQANAGPHGELASRFLAEYALHIPPSNGFQRGGVGTLRVAFGESAASPISRLAEPHAFILTGAPTAFQPEWPTVM